MLARTDKGRFRSFWNTVFNLGVFWNMAFNKEMKSMSVMVNRGSYNANLNETCSLFKWEPIGLEKTLIDMCDSLENIQLNQNS